MKILKLFKEYYKYATPFYCSSYYFDHAYCGHKSLFYLLAGVLGFPKCLRPKGIFRPCQTSKIAFFVKNS